MGSEQLSDYEYFRQQFRTYVLNCSCFRAAFYAPGRLNGAAGTFLLRQMRAACKMEELSLEQ
jgi:hypothetical protein